MELNKILSKYQELKYTDAQAAMVEIEKIQSIIEKTQDPILITRIRYYIAECQYYNGKIEEAYQSCLAGEHSLFYYQNCEEVAKYYNLIGLICSEKKKELKALKYYIRGIDYAEEYNMQDMLGIFYNNIADLYERLDDHESAIRYFKKSIAIYNKIQEKESIKAVVCMNIAASYCMIKNYIEAKKYYLCSESYFKKKTNNQKYYELSLLSVKCMIEFGQKKNKLALESFEKIIILVKQNMLHRNNFRYIINICRYMIEYGYGEQIINFYSYLEEKLEEWKKIGCYLPIVRLGVLLYQSIGMEQKAKEKALEYVYLHENEEKHMCELLVSSMNAQFELLYIKKEQKEILRQSELLEEKVNKDSLTKLYNRFAMNNIFESKFFEATNHSIYVGIGIIDIDYFKQFNDAYGHLDGDNCLVSITKTMLELEEENIMFMRYGGDEFLMMTFNRTPKEVQEIATQLKEKICNLQIVHKATTLKEKVVSISQGIYCGIPNEFQTLEDFIQLADEALYEGKQTRNSVVVHQDTILI